MSERTRRRSVLILLVAVCSVVVIRSARTASKPSRRLARIMEVSRASNAALGTTAQRFQNPVFAPRVIKENTVDLKPKLIPQFVGRVKIAYQSDFPKFAQFLG